MYNYNIKPSYYLGDSKTGFNLTTTFYIRGKLFIIRCGK